MMMEQGGPVRLYTAILSCCCAFCQVPSDPRGTKSEKCSIEGKVLDSVTADPVKKTRIYLLPLGSSGSIPYATDSDASGHYLINEVDPGRYELRVYREGYSSLASGRTFTLESGDDLKDVVLKLVPLGLISGRVLDEDRQPVTEATIECLRPRYLDGLQTFAGVAETKTNDLGDFRLLKLSPGECVIRATPPPPKGEELVRERPTGQWNGQAAAPEQKDLPTYYPQTTKLDAASRIGVTPGAQLSGMNITLLRSNTVRVSGRIKSPGSANQSDVGVQLRADAEELLTHSDAQGMFHFTGVVPDSYVLYAVGDDGYRARVPIDVGERDIDEIEVTLQPPVNIQGRVVFEGKRTPGSDLPELTLMSTAGWEGRPIRLQEGLTFKLDGLTRGLYRFRVERISDPYIKRIRIGEQETADAAIDLTYGDPGEVTLFLSPNAAVVEGSVKNAKDEPAPRVLVTMVPETSRRTRLHRIARTDQSGHFKLEGVIPGEYKIYAWEQIEDGAWEDPDFMKAYEARGKKISVKEGTHETVDLKLIAPEQQ